MYLVKLSGFCPSGNKAVRPQEQTGPVGPLRCTHLSLRMFKPEAGLRSCDLHAPVDLDHVRSFKVCSRASKGTNCTDGTRKLSKRRLRRRQDDQEATENLMLHVPLEYRV